MLAKYGDALATLTGWGRLFVGSILIALATSLPELATNASSVRLDPPNPGLALGDILGSNMVNMVILALVALIFGGKRFLQRVAQEQRYLAVAAALLTGAVLLFGALRLEVSFLKVGLSSVIILVLFVATMRVVYITRPQGSQEDAGDDAGITLGRAWLMFGLVSVGVIVAGFFLAWSTDQIAGITGVASSTLGILAVSLVTSMPEVAATIAAARLGAADLGVSTLYGSCAFNTIILSCADLFYRDGILNNQMEPAHFVAGGVAVLLILFGLVLIMGQHRLHRVLAAGGLTLMAAIYLGGAVVVATLGAPEGDSGDTTSSLQVARLDHQTG